jgi:flagellar basal-body rod protein FlgF
MDNSFMVGLSAQQVLQQRMDMTANNLANMTTAGFKAERLVTRELSERPAAAHDIPNEIAFVDAWMLQRDFSTGPMEQTGNPLDLAIEGEGFFVIQTSAGEAYTRDGRFMLDDQGQVVTRSGDLVLGDGGPIKVDLNNGDFTISREGTLTQNNAQLGTFRTVAFDTPAALEKVGNNLWRATDEKPRPPENSHIAPGFVEGSNVNAVAELTQMIEISRAYQAVSKMISDSDQLRAASIEKLARI